MEPTKAANRLTHEITDYFLLPDTICFEFIQQRMLWAIAIGYELGRSSLNKGKMVVQMTMAGKTLRVFAHAKAAAKALDLHQQSISRACRGVYKSAGGYTWRFLDPNDYYNYIKKID